MATKEGGSLTASPQIEGECPYCEDGVVFIGDSKDDDGDAEPAAFHSDPACEKYIETDLLTFVSDFRKKREAGIILSREVKH